MMVALIYQKMKQKKFLLLLIDNQNVSSFDENFLEK